MISVMRIIDGKRYSTDTAELLIEISGTEDSRSFEWESTGLYRTPKGAYFLAGEGGPMSRWRERASTGGWNDGYGIRVLPADQALSILEDECATKVIEKHFGASIVDA